MKHFLHYGLQRSGTNFARSLLSRNYRVNFLNTHHERFFKKEEIRSHPSHKHFRLYEDKSLIPEPAYHNDRTFGSFGEYLQALDIQKEISGILIISKDPYSWYLSYQKWAEKCNWPQPQHHYVEEYVQFYGKWNQFKKQDGRIHFLRYRDLITQPKNEFDKLEKKFGLQLNTLAKLFGKKFALKRVSKSKRMSQDQMRDYIHKQYLKKLDKQEVLEINSILDYSLIEEMGYQMEMDSAISYSRSA